MNLLLYTLNNNDQNAENLIKATPGVKIIKQTFKNENNAIKVFEETIKASSGLVQKISFLE